MEYKNGTPALHWFNYAGLAAANEMDWNEAEACPIPKSETKLNAINTREFDWLDCPDLTQNNAIDQPAIDTEDLSVTSFDAGHKPSGKVADNNDSLAMAQASVAGMVDSNAAPPHPPMQSKAPQSWYLSMLMLMIWPPWKIQFMMPLNPCLTRPFSVPICFRI